MPETAVVQQMPSAISRYDQREVIETIAQTVAKGASPAQLQMFLQVCKRTGLDPFLKEIWYVPEKGIIMAGRDGYLRVANENPQFDGMETRVERDDKKIPVKAVCTVWRKDRGHPITCEAYFNEYKKGSPVWTQYPSAMISKVAEVLALKRSFAINGVVSEEEIGEGGNAAQEVAERKIAELKAQRSAEPEPLPEPKPALSALEAVLATFGKVASIAAAFAELKVSWKKVLDVNTWDAILLEHNCDGVKSFGTVGNARKCFRVLWETLQKEMEASGTGDEAPQASTQPEGS
jgi:phage recombination protein Bet